MKKKRIPVTPKSKKGAQANITPVVGKEQNINAKFRGKAFNKKSSFSTIKPKKVGKKGYTMLVPMQFVGVVPLKSKKELGKDKIYSIGTWGLSTCFGMCATYHDQNNERSACVLGHFNDIEKANEIPTTVDIKKIIVHIKSIFSRLLEEIKHEKFNSVGNTNPAIKFSIVTGGSTFLNQEENRRAIAEVLIDTIKSVIDKNDQYCFEQKNNEKTEEEKTKSTSSDFFLKILFF